MDKQNDGRGFDGGYEAEVQDAAPTNGESVVKKIELTLDTNERQERYVKSQQAKAGGSGIVFADAFIRGMRDIGYKNPAWAFAEMLDNSIQAGASVMEFRLGYDSKSNAKPDQVALIDNGAGMIPKMISYAVRWGGTDRENDRHGFGRYGYGLPSSAVSMARRYTVYSKTANDNWHSVTIDLEEISKTAGDAAKTEALLQPKPTELPTWLLEYPAKSQKQLDLKTMKSGSIVVLEDLDRLKNMGGWTLTKAFETKLLQYFGVIYRHWLSERSIIVNDTVVEPVDPLFVTPQARFYAETTSMAVPLPPKAFEMESPSGEKGVVRIRASVLPPDFQSQVPGRLGRGTKLNSRFGVMREFNGLLICREGRQIDHIQPEWTKFQNMDRNIKVEIDFDPVLDEYFGITTSKQQITVDERMWEKLKQDGKESGGLIKLIQDMRVKFRELDEELQAIVENSETTEEPRPSEQAMADAERFKVLRATPTPEQVEEAKANLEAEAEKRSKDESRPKEDVKEELEKATQRKRWEVEFDAIEEGPFYIPKRLGQQKRIIINTAHPFYSKVYNQATGIKSALEILLFVLADGEIDAHDDRAEFYKNERVNCWSPMLRHALDKLIDDESLTNKASSNLE